MSNLSERENIVGLNEYSQNLLKSEIKKVGYSQEIFHYFSGKILPGPKKDIFESTVKIEPTDETCRDIYDIEHSLYRYTLEDGTVYEEFIQAEDKNCYIGGSIVFLALNKECLVDPYSLWTNDQIEKIVKELTPY